MNSITRLILRRVASGNIKLTPRWLQILKEVELEHPEAGPPKNAANDPAASSDRSDREPLAGERHLTFVNPLPGRWIRRTECGWGGALLLAASLAHAAGHPVTTLCVG